MGPDCCRKPFRNCILPLDLEAQDEEETHALLRESGKADMGRVTLYKWQKNHIEGNSKVMVRGKLER